MDTNKLSEFEHAYLEAALWSSWDQSNEQGGQPLDASYGFGDLAPELVERVKADCASEPTEQAVEEWAAKHDNELNRFYA
jgi:hypothetical protein